MSCDITAWTRVITLLPMYQVLGRRVMLAALLSIIRIVGNVYTNRRRQLTVDDDELRSRHTYAKGEVKVKGKADERQVAYACERSTK